MAINDLPVLSALRTKMQWHQERQRLLAENVANADTPAFRPRDLQMPLFENANRTALVAPVALTRTAENHIAGASGSGGSNFQVERKSNFDVRPAGNAVNLEDQMMKVSANQMDYAAVTSLYTRSLGMLKTAIGKR